MAEKLDGKALSDKIKHDVAEGVKAYKEKYGEAPGLATILVGEDPASAVYVNNKIKSTSQVGMQSYHHKLPASTTEIELLELVHQLNHDPKVQGILVQLPLPAHIDNSKILLAIHPDKDVDGFHPYNIGRMMMGEPTLLPCTPYGVWELLKHYHIPIKGRDVVVMGRSNIVGKPMASIMLNEASTVTVVHRHSADVPAKIRQADILIVAIGKPKFVTADCVKKGAVVVDVGINRLPDGSICGDVDYENVQHVASFITPVPGGVGPMTIAMLLKNTLQSAINLKNK